MGNLAKDARGAHCEALMTMPPPDGSRDRRIEDPSNRWLIHSTARALLPAAIRLRISANAVSVAGLVLGAGAAWAYADWRTPALAVVGLILSVGWLIADGLDGMVARATGTSSAFGRFMDGICDHGVFALIYISLAASVGTAQAWGLAVVAAAAHAVQSSLYEGDRTRFHRRLRGVAEVAAPALSTNPLVKLYDSVAGSIGRLGRPFETALAASNDPVELGRAYAAQAMAPMRLMILLTANTRVWLIFIACLLRRPVIFWWAEIVALSIIAVVGLAWHRRIEARFAGEPSFHRGDRPSSFA